MRASYQACCCRLHCQTPAQQARARGARRWSERTAEHGVDSTLWQCRRFAACHLECVLQACNCAWCDAQVLLALTLLWILLDVTLSLLLWASRPVWHRCDALCHDTHKLHAVTPHTRSNAAPVQQACIGIGHFAPRITWGTACNSTGFV